MCLFFDADLGSFREGGSNKFWGIAGPSRPFSRTQRGAEHAVGGRDAKRAMHAEVRGHSSAFGPRGSDSVQSNVAQGLAPSIGALSVELCSTAESGAGWANENTDSTEIFKNSVYCVGENP